MGFIDKDPEVLALQELCGFTQESLSLLAEKWGHGYSEIVKEDGYPVGITSKKPIKLKRKIVEGIGHGLLHVETYGYSFLVTHLNPSDTKKRLQEAERIVDYIIIVPKINTTTNLNIMIPGILRCRYNKEFRELVF